MIKGPCPHCKELRPLEGTGEKYRLAPHAPNLVAAQKGEKCFGSGLAVKVEELVTETDDDILLLKALRGEQLILPLRKKSVRERFRVDKT